MYYLRFLLINLTFLLALTASSMAAKNLDIYVIDVEGGKSVLLVSPSGRSMLFDLGWPTLNGHEASTRRIVEAAKAAGLSRIDLVVVSHFDIDHIGDLTALAAKLPIGHVFDHGGSQTNARFAAYAAARDKIGHTVLQPGDKVPLADVNIQVLSARGKLVKLKGTPNPLCNQFPQAAALPTDLEDDNSIGLLIQFGKFRMLDLADLEAHPSHDLVCPANMIGRVDVYNVNVHGQFKGIAPELVNVLKAPVIIQANGPRKGADSRSWPVLKNAPGLKDIWQIHTSLNAGAGANPPDNYIANAAPPDLFKWIKLSARKNGTFIVSTMYGFSKVY